MEIGQEFMVGRQRLSGSSFAWSQSAALLQVVGARQCTICVVCGKDDPPFAASSAKIVREDWLLQAAEKYKLPSSWEN